MLLTKKSGAAQAGARSPFTQSLQRGLSHALPTMDRRAFLRRSGLGVGVGIAASSLTLVHKAPEPRRALPPPSAKARSRSSARCAATARWAAQSMP